MFLLAAYTLFDAVHPLDTGEVALVVELIAVFELAQVTQLGLHEHDLRLGVIELVPQHVCLLATSCLQCRQSLRDRLAGLDALVGPRVQAQPFLPPLHQ
jgi:hypothetical protein